MRHRKSRSRPNNMEVFLLIQYSSMPRSSRRVVRYLHKTDLVNELKQSIRLLSSRQEATAINVIKSRVLIEYAAKINYYVASVNI